MSRSFSIDDIQDAQRRIHDHIKHTPLIRNDTLSRRFGTNLYLKEEIFQKTGSFKVRGAFNKILSLSPEERSRGVVAVSGGNHAQAVAYAASTVGMKSLVLMPRNTSKNSIEATRGYGTQVVLTASLEEAFEKVADYEKNGFVLVHPFDDAVVMAGQGTLGLELLSELPDLTDVVVSIGGGGLIGGIATAVKSLSPGVRVWGVETEGADAMSKALAKGEVVRLSAVTSIAKTLGAPAVSPATLALAQKYVEKVIVVSDADAVGALRFLLERVKILTEPAASCTLAAAEKLQDQWKPQDHVALVLCGGNISLSEICTY